MTRPRACLCALLIGAGLGARGAGAVTLPADKLSEAPIPPAASEAEAAYLAAVHAQVHHRWTDNFLRLIGEKLEANDPLNQPGRSAEAEVVIGPDGQLVSSKVVRPSGFPGFDDAIGEILRDAVPFPLPPLAVRSDDDNLHLHWVFARDARRDSGLTVLHLYDPIEGAMPKLLRAGRRDEALARVALARSAGLPVAAQVTLLAAAWTKAALRDPNPSLRLLEVLARRGDAEAVSGLKLAVRRPGTAAEAGALLAELKIPVCPLVKDLLGSQNAAERHAAASALGAAGDPACAPGLIALLSDAGARPEARAAAATALGTLDDEASKKALAEAAKQDNPTIEAAAILAQVRPGSGRVKVIAMERTLRDPSAELRAASAAGVVRAGGDTNLADLYVLFKDSDPRPALAALRELARLHTEESTKLIARLARRPQLEVEKAAADILLRRNARDSFSAFKPYLDPKADPGMRGRALVIADEATLKGLLDDPQLGPWVYRARLGRAELDLAADWLAGPGAKLPRPALTDAMAEWLARVPATPAPASAVAPTADKAPR